jgi:hypothetical protein
LISCIRVLRLDPDFDDEGFVSASVPCGSAHDVLGAATPCVVLAAQRGGGGDGGTTGAENRTAFMEMYKTKRVGELDRVEERKAQWTSCALSGAPLTAPVVADALGALYNKEALVQALMAQLQGAAKLPSHLSLKTITELKLGGDGSASSPWSCAVTGTPLSPAHRFYAHRGTGLVVQAKALHDMKDLVREALREAGAVGPEDGIEMGGEKGFFILHGTDEERAELAEEVRAKMAALAEKKKGKKNKRGEKTKEVRGGVEKKGSSSKKWVAADHVPTGATPEVWKSIFVGKKDESQERNSFTARGTLGRGVNL